MNALSGRIKKRIDGGWDVDHGGLPYGPITADSEGLYTLEEVESYAAEHPDFVDIEEAPTDEEALSALKSALCTAVEASKAKLLRAGITFRDGPITCDDEALRLLTSYCTKDAQGRLNYPASWLRPDRSILILVDRADLIGLSDVMEYYAEGVDFGLVTAQAAINAATTIEAAQAAFDAWAQEVNL